MTVFSGACSLVHIVCSEAQGPKVFQLYTTLGKTLFPDINLLICEGGILGDSKPVEAEVPEADGR